MTPPNPVAALIATSLTRRFGTQMALRGVDVALHRGECLAVLGPNGAGKTTLMRILALTMSPTTGSLQIAGIDVGRNTPQARRLVGFISHRTGLYDDLTPRENLRFYGRLYDVPSLDQRIDRALDEVGLPVSAAAAPVRTLSRGMQQRAGLARAILHEPALLLMDEPETGLDPQGQAWFVELVSSWVGANRAVVVATHRLDLVERFANRAIVLENGVLKVELPIDPSPSSSLADAYRAAIGAAS